MNDQYIRQYECGHHELIAPDAPRFSWCYQCGATGVESDRLKCSMPTCRNPATRVVRYSSPAGVTLHYCDECRSVGELHEDRVRDRRRLRS